MRIKNSILPILIVIFGIVSAVPCTAQLYFSDKGVAIDGYDVVAYYIEGEAVEGLREHRVEWNDLYWRFANAEHAAAFAESPELYAPQYGGYCAYAAANNAIAPVDPEAFSIVDGKLYLNFSRRVRRRWERAREKYIELADNFWPALQDGLYYTPAP